MGHGGVAGSFRGGVGDVDVGLNGSCRMGGSWWGWGARCKTENRCYSHLGLMQTVVICVSLKYFKGG